MKYSAMIEKNREVSIKKINLAKQTIEDMLENHEKISVSMEILIYYAGCNDSQNS